MLPDYKPKIHIPAGNPGKAGRKDGEIRGRQAEKMAKAAEKVPKGRRKLYL